MFNLICGYLKTFLENERSVIHTLRVFIVNTDLKKIPMKIFLLLFILRMAIKHIYLVKVETNLLQRVRKYIR